MRLLFWIALVILVIAAVRSKWRAHLRAVQRQAEQAAAMGGARAEPAAMVEAETMACCAHCHLHFPASEAIHANGLEYCSADHVGRPARQAAP